MGNNLTKMLPDYYSNYEICFAKQKETKDIRVTTMLFGMLHPALRRGGKKEKTFAATPAAAIGVRKCA